MKKAIVTIAGGEYFLRMAALTHPTFQAYARRIGVDFLVWSDLSGYQIPEYKKLEIGKLLDEYDRVLYLDTDVIVRDDTPDIFEIVPDDHLGMLEESRYYDRRTSVLRFMEHVGFDSTKWNGKYYNAGIFVCSKVHRDVFVRPPVEWDHFRDQTWFNTLIADRGVKVFSLPYRFNRVLGLDRVYGEDRLDAYFLHYAGISIVRSREETLEIIAHDLEMWRRAAPHYQFRHNIALVVQGGLKHAVAAEPAARFARDALYRGDNLILVTHFPEVFRHLQLPTFATLEAVPSLGKYHQRFTRERPDGDDGLVRHQMHDTTLAALVALGMELPLDGRRPRLDVDAEALASVRAKVSRELESLVILYPEQGRGANAFPPDVWQDYAEALMAAGFPVAVAGRSTEGVTDFDRSRTIDLVDRLSLTELIALISRAAVLITNDSAAVPLAGAFDTWLGLIATLRHPEHVLPWRNGSPYWRAKNLAPRALDRDFLQRPSDGTPVDLDRCDTTRLRECLAEPQAIVEFARAAKSER